VPYAGPVPGGPQGLLPAVPNPPPPSKATPGAFPEPPPGPSPAPPIVEAIPFEPLPPLNPPGPPLPPLGARSVWLEPVPPGEPLTSIVPAIVTSPLARIVTGVFAAFFVKRTVTLDGILTVVKLKTPEGGSVRVVVAVGLNGPSAPVLPLLKVCAIAIPPPRTSRPDATPLASLSIFRIGRLLPIRIVIAP